MESMSALGGDAATIPETTGELPLVGLPPRAGHRLLVLRVVLLGTTVYVHTCWNWVSGSDGYKELPTYGGPVEPWSVVWGVDKVGLQDQAMIREFQDVKPPWPPAAKCPRGTAGHKGPVQSVCGSMDVLTQPRIPATELECVLVSGR